MEKLDHKHRHLRITRPSPWVERFSGLVKPGGTVLDLASGGGRHGRLFLERGHPVTFLDKNTDPVADLGERADILTVDLEDGRDIFTGDGPLASRTFDAVVVVNYLYRDHIEPLIGALAPGGVFIYETFARGNERFTRPRNPDHLLKSGELLEAVSGKLQVVAYEHGIVEAADLPGVKQRLCAVNDLGPGTREDGDPEPHAL